MFFFRPLRVQQSKRLLYDLIHIHILPIMFDYVFPRFNKLCCIIFLLLKAEKLNTGSTYARFFSLLRLLLTCISQSSGFAPNASLRCVNLYVCHRSRRVRNYLKLFFTSHKIYDYFNEMIMNMNDSKRKI